MWSPGDCPWTVAGLPEYCTEFRHPGMRLRIACCAACCSGKRLNSMPAVADTRYAPVQRVSAGASATERMGSRYVTHVESRLVQEIPRGR